VSMARMNIYAVVLLCAFFGQSSASEVSGRITIEKSANSKLVGPNVYELRGIAVSNGMPASVPNGYERVAMWLESSSSSSHAPLTATMQQRNRELEPNLLIIPVGSTVEFPNLDPVFHNVFSLSRTQSFDLGYYPEGRTRSIKFRRAGIVQVYCHIHPNMYGVIVVTSSQWFGKPAADGTFTWADVPAGSYTLCVWQKSVGVVHKKLVVPSAGSVHVNVALPDEDSEN